MVITFELIVLLIIIIVILVCIMYTNTINAKKFDKIDVFKKYLNTKDDTKSTHDKIEEKIQKNNFKKIEIKEDDICPTSIKTKEINLLKNATIYNELDSKNKTNIKILLNKNLLFATKKRNRNKLAKLKIKSKMLDLVEKFVLSMLFKNNKRNKEL